jgi:division/cell wall cluster transcriptional repressor MraZ
VAERWIAEYLEWHHGVTKWIGGAARQPRFEGGPCRGRGRDAEPGGRRGPGFGAATDQTGEAMQFSALNAELTLDPKGRVMLPRQLRDELEREGMNRLVAFANAGPKSGLAFTTVPAFDRMSRENQDADPMSPRARLFALAVRSTAQVVTVDNVGRVLIPKELRDLLGLERGLYLFTSGAWFEVWDHERWAQQAYPQAAALWDQLYGFGALQPGAGGAA